MSVVIEPRRYDDPDVVRLVAAVQAEYIDRYGSEDAANVEPAEFDEPAGRFFVGIDQSGVVATGGWRQIADGIAEIKRMYVVPAARRRGLAKAMLAELEAAAAAAGIRHLVLNTGPEQPEAIGLYEASGYVPIAGFGHYACHEAALFFGKDLTLASTMLAE